MIIVACDPGLVNGWAVYDTDRGLVAMEESAEGVPFTEADVYVIEKYIVTDRKVTQQNDALHVSGVVADTARRVGAKVVFQTPATAKRFSTDDKLKALGWYTRTKDGHANDAARHLLRYCEQKKLLRPADRALLRKVLG